MDHYNHQYYLMQNYYYYSHDYYQNNYFYECDHYFVPSSDNCYPPNFGEKPILEFKY